MEQITLAFVMEGKNIIRPTTALKGIKEKEI